MSVEAASRQPPENDSPVSPPRRYAGGGSRRINALFVEDIQSIAQVLIVGLDFFGITLSPIYDSAEQFLLDLQRPEMDQIDLFIFDIRLPHLTGTELASRLREQGDERPVLLVSAWAPPPPEELKRLQADYLPKPFNIRQLAQHIRDLVARHQAAQI